MVTFAPATVPPDESNTRPFRVAVNVCALRLPASRPSASRDTDARQFLLRSFILPSPCAGIAALCAHLEALGQGRNVSRAHLGAHLVCGFYDTAASHMSSVPTIVRQHASAVAKRRV